MPARYPTYLTFISYSQANQKKARRLQRFIEHHPMVRARKAEGGPWAVFRDTTGLPATENINEELKEALNHSQSLILFLSEEAIRSPWVEAELAYFHTSRKDALILPVIAAGDPLPQARASSFPALRRLAELANPVQPVKPTMESMGPTPFVVDCTGGVKERRSSRSKIIAALLGVSLDLVCNRERDRFRRRMAYGSLGAYGLGALLLILALHWNQTSLDSGLSDLHAQIATRQVKLGEARALAQTGREQLQSGAPILAEASFQNSLQLWPEHTSTRIGLAEAKRRTEGLVKRYNFHAQGPPVMVQSKLDSSSFICSSGENLFVYGSNGVVPIAETRHSMRAQRVETWKWPAEAIDQEGRILFGLAEGNMDEDGAVSTTSASFHDISTGQQTIIPFPEEVLWTRISRSGDIGLVVCWRNTYLVRRDTGEPTLLEIDPPLTSIEGALFSPDDQWLAVLTQGRTTESSSSLLHLISLKTSPRLVSSYPVPFKYPLLFGRKDWFCAAPKDGESWSSYPTSLVFHSFSDQDAQVTVQMEMGRYSPPNFLGMSPSGKYSVFCSNDRTQIFDFTHPGGRMVQEISLAYSKAEWSDDESDLLLYGGSSLRVISLKKDPTLEGFETRLVMSTNGGPCSLHPSGDFVAYSEGANAIGVASVDSPGLIWMLGPLKSPPTAMAFLANGELLTTGDESDFLSSWDWASVPVAFAAGAHAPSDIQGERHFLDNFSTPNGRAFVTWQDSLSPDSVAIRLLTTRINGAEAVVEESVLPVDCTPLFRSPDRKSLAVRMGSSAIGIVDQSSGDVRELLIETLHIPDHERPTPFGFSAGSDALLYSTLNRAVGSIRTLDGEVVDVLILAEEFGPNFGELFTTRLTSSGKTIVGISTDAIFRWVVPGPGTRMRDGSKIKAARDELAEGFSQIQRTGAALATAGTRKALNLPETVSLTSYAWVVLDEQDLLVGFKGSTVFAVSTVDFRESVVADLGEIVTSVTSGGDGLLYFGTKSGAVHEWDLLSGDARIVLLNEGSNSDPRDWMLKELDAVYGLAYHDDLLVTVTGKGIASIWFTPSFEKVTDIPLPQLSIRSTFRHKEGGWKVEFSAQEDDYWITVIAHENLQVSR